MLYKKHFTESNGNEEEKGHKLSQSVALDYLSQIRRRKPVFPKINLTTSCQLEEEKNSLVENTCEYYSKKTADSNEYLNNLYLNYGKTLLRKNNVNNVKVPVKIDKNLPEVSIDNLINSSIENINTNSNLEAHTPLSLNRVNFYKSRRYNIGQSHLVRNPILAPDPKNPSKYYGHIISKRYRVYDQGQGYMK